MTLLLVITFLVGVTTANISNNLKVYQDGNLKFSMNVFKELVKSGSDNPLVSPLSADIGLAMALLGAYGETQLQLAAGTHLVPIPEKLNATFAELLPTLESSDKYTFELANKIYVQNSFKIDEQYHHDVVNNFKADIENINFKEKNNAVATVNRWVSAKTYDKIKSIIKRENLNDDTRLILLNAIYFKGMWFNGFKNEDTKQLPFYIDATRFVNTDMMISKGSSFAYYEDLENKVKLLELPYKGDDVTMTIVLPDDPEGISVITNNLENIIVGSNYFYPCEVNLRLPKFKISSNIELTDILKSLGIILPFDDGADFSGMIHKDNVEPLKIANVLQEVAIEVDEQGTVASSATGVVMETWRAAREIDKVNFFADHPFIFYLRHEVAGIIFIGKYDKPTGCIQTGKYIAPNSFLT